MYDVKKFNAEFNIQLEQLQGAEKITKDLLSPMSRTLLAVVHDDLNPDVQPINRLLDALTPVNRKACVLFFQHFSGHQYNNEQNKFVGRDKKLYAQKAEMSKEFLEDPLNNVWTWATRHIEIGAKEFKLETVTTYIANVLKKADKAKISHADVLRAVMAGGLSPEEVGAILMEMVPEKLVA